MGADGSSPASVFGFNQSSSLVSAFSNDHILKRKSRVEEAGLIERVLQALPIFRRPYFQRDSARNQLVESRREIAELNEQLKSLAEQMSGSKVLRRWLSSQAAHLGIPEFSVFRQSTTYALSEDDARQDREIGDFRNYIE